MDKKERYEFMCEEFGKGRAYLEVLVFSSLRCKIILRLQQERATSNVVDVWRGEYWRSESKYGLWYRANHAHSGYCDSYIFDDVKSFLIENVGDQMLPGVLKDLKSLTRLEIKRRINALIDIALDYDKAARNEWKPKEEK